MRRHDSGLTLIEILVLLASFAILGAIVTVAFMEAQKRARTSRTRQDMRALATAIDTYTMESSICPAWGIGRKGYGRVRSFNWDVAQRTGNRSGVSRLPSFLICDRSTPAGRFNTLVDAIGFTSTKGGQTYDVGPPGQPFTYIASYPPDRFCADKGATFVYWAVFPGGAVPAAWPKLPASAGVGFILVSPGPDGDYDLPGSYDVYNPGIAQPSTLLLAGTNAKGSAFTYDPTNGLISNGDIWRVKQ